MRDITTVVNEMISKIPEEEDCLIAILKEIIKFAYYNAPENSSNDWDKIAYALDTSLPKPPTEAWQFEIGALFANMSVEQYREFIDEIQNRK